MKKFKVDAWNNFCRVFETPAEYPKEYCFGGGIPTQFTMVDWFYPVAEVGQAGIPKDHPMAEKLRSDFHEITADELAERLTPFLQQKNYIKPGRTYIVLCDFGAVFSFIGEDK